MNEWINEWKQVKWKQTCIINIQFCFHTFYSETNFKSNFNSFERRKECLGKNILVCIDNMTIKANNLKKSNIKKVLRIYSFNCSGPCHFSQYRWVELAGQSNNYDWHPVTEGWIEKRWRVGHRKGVWRLKEIRLARQANTSTGHLVTSNRPGSETGPRHCGFMVG